MVWISLLQVAAHVGTDRPLRTAHLVPSSWGCSDSIDGSVAARQLYMLLCHTKAPLLCCCTCTCAPLSRLAAAVWVDGWVDGCVGVAAGWVVAAQDGRLSTLLCMTLMWGWLVSWALPQPYDAQQQPIVIVLVHLLPSSTISLLTCPTPGIERLLLLQEGLESFCEAAVVLSQPPLCQLLVHLSLCCNHVNVCLRHLDSCKLSLPACAHTTPRQGSTHVPVSRSRHKVSHSCCRSAHTTQTLAAAGTKLGELIELPPCVLLPRIAPLPTSEFVLPCWLSAQLVGLP